MLLLVARARGLCSRLVLVLAARARTRTRTRFDRVPIEYEYRLTPEYDLENAEILDF